MMKKKLYIFIVIILSFLIFATYKIFVENKTIVEKDTILAMDTQISWVIYEKPSLYPLDLNEKIKTRIDELVKLLSVTDENSEIYKVNHHQERDIKLSEDTKNVVLFALQMAEKTNGALEPTIYPVLREWGFTTGKYQIPDETTIRALLNYEDYRKVSLKENQIYLPDGMQIDLGAVAKGYIGDEIIKILKANNISSALINLGGNVQLLGTKPNGDLWNIGLKSPNSQDYIGILRLADCAIVTSGNYERYFIGEDNKRYWHILDGKTGKPADKHINSVTIVTKQGKLGDALSTALFVMGVDEAINYWKKNKDENDAFEMILITDDKKIYITENLVDSFTLQDKYKDYHMVVVTL